MQLYNLCPTPTVLELADKFKIKPEDLLGKKNGEDLLMGVFLRTRTHINHSIPHNYRNYNHNTLQYYNSHILPRTNNNKLKPHNNCNYRLAIHLQDLLNYLPIQYLTQIIR